MERIGPGSRVNWPRRGGFALVIITTGYDGKWSVIVSREV